MKSFTQWFGAVAAIVAMAGTAVAADAISAGKVKSTDAAKKTFVVTDNAGKDHTFQFGEPCVVNRSGKESKIAPTVGETVNVFCDDAPTLTARYILVQDGASKTCTLVRGTVKSYDAAKKQLAFTDDSAKNWTFPMGEAGVQLNGQASRMEDIKAGDHALIIVDAAGATPSLREVMVDRTSK
jgi:hypothetical protein